CIRFDESLERCFRRIVGIRERLSSQQWEQLTLDTKHGGFGLASCSGSRHIAYVASVVGCLANLRQIFTRFQLGVELAASRPRGSASHSACDNTSSACGGCGVETGTESSRSSRNSRSSGAPRSRRWWLAPADCSIG